MVGEHPVPVGPADLLDTPGPGVPPGPGPLLQAVLSSLSQVVAVEQLPQLNRRIT